MSKVDLTEALTAIQPKTKAAKVREVMPLIEQRIAAGVRIADILRALRASGLELNEATLKSYLYRNRKKQGIAADAGPVTTRSTQTEVVGHPVSDEPGSATHVRSQKPVSMQDLDRIMKPDPAKEAEDLARYERLAKQQRRKRRP